MTFDLKQNIISYMKRDSRLSSVLHALLHMAEQDGPVTSETLAQCLGTNPVVVRRTMGYLREAGIVTSDRGHAGGWRIHADLGAVTLRQLHEALPAMRKNLTPIDHETIGGGALWLRACYTYTFVSARRTRSPSCGPYLWPAWPRSSSNVTG